MKTRPCQPWLGVAATRTSATARSEAAADRFTFPSSPQRDDASVSSAYHLASQRAHRSAAGFLEAPCSLHPAVTSMVVPVRAIRAVDGPTRDDDDGPRCHDHCGPTTGAGTGTRTQPDMLTAATKSRA